MKIRYAVSAFVISVLLSGCSLFVVADAAVTVVATTVKVGAKVVGAAADAIIPDGDDGKHDKQEKKSD
ncbi:MAG TPA: NF038104 family lipoprotein [Aromatoleum sp.]|uniref:NF038104 family lipoprotein n=1 Tax=Aromatoleum sp. TaxID=2307007 RepID=UPI002B46CE9B|nr:NF038104 family lipoprotein [Aromatoleum sp.]HJV27244.1 NF038104 family lipoprotein [Aromatoleum sp.]